MPDQIKKYTDPLKARWDVLTTPQRYKLFAVIGVVLVAILITAFFALRTPWTVIVDRQDFTTVAPMHHALEDAGIRSAIINGGRGLQVDSRRVDEARVVIEVEGAAPHAENFSWDDALDTGLGTTDDERRLRYVRATEGSIERQLGAMEGIASARVGLSIPNRRPFERDATGPSASVTLHTTRDFSRQQGRDLALLVARRVSDLDIENIIIMNQDARTIWNGLDDANDDPVATALEMQENRRNLAVIGAKQVLSPAFDEVHAWVAPTFSDIIETITEERLVSIPEGMEGGGIPRREQIERSEMEGGTGGAEPGLQPQTATFPTYNMPGGGIMSASQRIQDILYEIDEVHRITRTGPGGLDVEASTAAIVVTNEIPIHQDIWMAQTPEGEEPRTQMDWEIFKSENTVADVVNGDEFAYFHALAARAVGLPIENVEFIVMQRIVPHDTIPSRWDWATILMVVVLLALLAMLVFGLLRRQRAAGEDEETLEPQLAVEDLLVSTQLEEAREEASQELEEIDYFKENEIKKHIEKFVNEKPEAVAALLRNWINVEEW